MLIGEDGEPIEPRARRRRAPRVRAEGGSKPPGRTRTPSESLPPPRHAKAACRADWLVVGLGNPATATRALATTWASRSPPWQPSAGDCREAKKRYAGLYTDGRTGPGGPRVGVLLPQTYMDESGSAAGPARGALGVELDHVVAVHDEIDLPFGRIEVRLGGGLAGHNGLKSLKRGLGSADFRRVRVGVGRPDTTDPEIVSAHVLGRFSEPKDEVRELIERAADELDRLVTGHTWGL